MTTQTNPPTYAELEKCLEILAARLADAVRDHDETRGERDRLAQMVENYAREVSNLRAIREGDKWKISDLDARLSTMSGNADRLLADANDRIAELERDLGQTQTIATARMNEVIALKARVAELERDLDETRKKLELAHFAIETRDRKIAALKVRVAELENAPATPFPAEILRERIRALEAQSGQQLAQIDTLETTIQDKNARIQYLEEVNERLAAKANEAREARNEAEFKLTQTETARANAVTAAKTSARRVEILEVEVEAAGKIIAGLEADLAKAREAAGLNLADWMNQQTRAEAAEAALAAARKERDELEADLAATRRAWNEDMDAKFAQIKTLEAERDRYKFAGDELAREVMAAVNDKFTRG